MTDASEYEAILTAIAMGIDSARRNPLPDEAHDEEAADRFAAWCVVQELRQAGFIIQQRAD